MDTQMVPFVFEGMRLKESCWMEGNPYFTYRAIGEFLEYEHPDRAIHKIVESNPNILTFRTLVSLTNVEGSRFRPNGHKRVIWFRRQGKYCLYPRAIKEGS